MAAHAAPAKYRPDIDGLRAIAVLMVVAFHAFPEHVRGGFIGVDVFFVISGYLISGYIFETSEAGRFSFAEFYRRRIRRIFPALALVLSCTLVAGWFVLFSEDFQRLGKEAAGGAAFVANLVLWGESGYFDPAAETKPLLHLWSLGIEEQFYLLYPVLVWLAYRRRWSPLGVTLAVFAASFAANLVLSRSDPVAAFYSPASRFWELMAGSLLAYAQFRQARQAPAPGITAHAASVAGLLLLAAGLALITRARPFPHWWAVLPVAGATLVIAAGPGAWVNRALLARPAMVWIGLLSYPLYLWHWVLLVFARLAAPEPPGVAATLALVAASFLLAWLTLRFVEQPLRFGRFRGAHPAVLVVPVAAAGLAGAAVLAAGGVPARFEVSAGDRAQYRALANYRFDWLGAYKEGACHVGYFQDASVFGKCTDRIEAGRDTILIWGDSFAAHLAHGYRTRFGATANVVQRTAAICPPVLDLETDRQPRNCPEINRAVLAELLALRPRKIVLAARWSGYDWRRINETTALLRRHGFTDVDVIGPVPEWRQPLPKLLFLQARWDLDHRVPQALPAIIPAEDSGLRQHVRDARYISPIAIACKDGRSCVTRVGEGTEAILSWDFGHLTLEGSDFIVSGFPEP